MGSRKILVFDPTSKKKAKGLNMAKRPVTLEGKVIGVVWNGKPGGDVLLNRFAELLKDRFRLTQILRLDHRADTFSNIPEDRMKELIEKCASVIVGVGD